MDDKIISFTLTTEQAKRLEDAFCTANNYSAYIVTYDTETGAEISIPNPESRTEFTKRMILDNIKYVVKSVEKAAQVKAAMASIIVPEF